MSKLNEMGVIMYLCMELGIDYREILELPLSVFNLLMEGVSNVYQEKNRLQEESMKGANTETVRR